MRVTVDTVVLFGLLNRGDQHHERPVRDYNDLNARHARFFVPRIVLVETFGLITRRKVGKDARLAAADRIRTLDWPLEEHRTGDFRQAESWWRQFADWPIDFPDALIVATSVRLGVDSIWTHDTDLGKFCNHAAPRLKQIGTGFRELSP